MRVLTFNSFRVVIVYLEHVAVWRILCSNVITNVWWVIKCLQKVKKEKKIKKISKLKLYDE